jgi:cell division initiation protein
MRITPLDIRKHAFPRQFSGYDREEVDAFLRVVAEDYEGLVRERDRIRKHAVALEARVQNLSANETILQDTLTTAQKLSEDMKRTTRKEAEVLLGEAEIKAEKVLDAAHRRAAKLAEDIREMRSLRTRLGAAVRATIETHLSLLESLSQDSPQDPQLDGKVAYLTTRTPGDRKPGGGA